VSEAVVVMHFENHVQGLVMQGRRVVELVSARQLERPLNRMTAANHACTMNTDNWAQNKRHSCLSIYCLAFLVPELPRQVSKAQESNINTSPIRYQL
jgi:hypothetical protein